MIKSDLMKIFKLALPAMFGIFMLTSNTSGAEMTTDNWDKIFAKSDKADVKKVTFKNRYGITLAGDLYIPTAAATI